MGIKQLLWLTTCYLFLKFCAGHMTSESQDRAIILGKQPHSKLGSLLALTRDYLRNANIYNTTVEFTVPLFSFKLPAIDDPDDHTALIRQNLLGQLVFFAVVVISFIASIAFPVYLNHLQSQNRSLFLMGKNASISVRKLHFDPKMCFQQALCEAQNNYKEYGIMTVPFLSLPLFSTIHELRNWSLELEESSNCHNHISCPFNLLRVIRYVLYLVWEYIHLI